MSDDRIESTESSEETKIDFQPIDVQPEPDIPEVIDFYIIEQKPEFPGGNETIHKWISEHLVFPKIAKENNIDGTVYVEFVIDIDGSVTDIKIIRGVDPSLENEAYRVVSMMPKWKPGKQNGKPVKVIFRLPIKFKLIN